MSGYFLPKNMKGGFTNYEKIMKRLLTGVLSLAAVFTTLPISTGTGCGKQYWTDAQEKAGYVEKS